MVRQHLDKGSENGCILPWQAPKRTVSSTDTRHAACTKFITAFELSNTELLTLGGDKNMPQRIVTGKTNPAMWKNYPNGTGVMVDVDTSEAHFAQTPLYFTSLGGISHHWATAGATSIYSATPTGFRIYVRWAEGAPLTIT